MKRKHGWQTFDSHFGKCATAALECLLAGGAGHDELGDHRVERTRDDVARFDSGVDAHARAARRFERVNWARGRHKVAASILAVNAELERVTAHLRVAIFELATLGDAELLAN